MSHPLEKLQYLLTSEIQQIPLPVPIEKYLAEFIENHPITLDIIQLQQFKRIFLSPINQVYVTHIFYYLILQSCISVDLKREQEAEEELKVTYLKIFQSIRNNKSTISHALLVCNVRVVYQIYRKILESLKKDKQFVQIDKIFVFRGIQKMMNIELGVSITIISVELMVERLFKSEKSRKSVLKMRKGSQISTEEKLLPRIGKSEPKLKSRAKSISLVRNSSLKYIKNSTFYNNCDTKTKINKLKLKLEDIKVAPKTPLKSKRLNYQLKTEQPETQSPLDSSPNPPYIRMLTQATEVLKYQKMKLYQEVAESANKASCQYQYQTPMEVLANNTFGKDMLNQIFRNNRITSSYKNKHVERKQPNTEGKAEVIKVLSKYVNIEPEQKKREKTQQEMFEEELMLGKYKNRSKQYRNAYKDLLG